ncbi:MAG TPA: hypothetical protein PLA43_19250 [Bryobacteraceae bacterium]|nr:hypothetical protein [Bryobacteraceae bacterium]
MSMSSAERTVQVLDNYEMDARLWRRGRNALALLALGGWAVLAAGYSSGSAAFYPAYLLAFVYWLTIALGALFFVMLQHLSGAAWSVTSRRVAETIALVIPLSAVLFLPIVFGLPQLYEWARPEVVAADPVLQAKQSYLNPRGFTLRAAACFLIWGLWAVILYRNSVKQDDGGTLELTRAAAKWSAPGMILLALTVSLASFDWLMSLDPHWFSTVFGIYIWSGSGLAGFAAITLVLLAFRRMGMLRASVNHEHYHDLGKWLFALTVFWAYIAFSQYMLIWYGNIPEETAWYHERTAGTWRSVAALLVFGRFFVPFAVLMPRAAKRNLAVLAGAAAWILLMQYVELFWVIMPVFRTEAGLMWIDVAAVAAVGATFALAFWWLLRRHALAPVGDLRFTKALEFTNV